MSLTLCHPINRLQHTRRPCPSLTPRACSNSCQLSLQCHSKNLILCHPILFPSSIFLGMRVFSNESTLIKWWKYWSFNFSISPSKWTFRTDFFYNWLIRSPCSPRDFQESSPTPQLKSMNFSVLSFIYGLILTFIHDYRKNHSFDYTNLCWKSNVSAF